MRVTPNAAARPIPRVDGSELQTKERLSSLYSRAGGGSGIPKGSRNAP
jgi:hypothetical protein